MKGNLDFQIIAQMKLGCLKLSFLFQSTLVDDYCYIHPTSVLNKKNQQYVIYQDIMEANGKVYLRGLLPIFMIDCFWLSERALVNTGTS